MRHEDTAGPGPEERDPERWELGLGWVVGLGFGWAGEGDSDVGTDGDDAGRPLDRLSLPR